MDKPLVVKRVILDQDWHENNYVAGRGMYCMYWYFVEQVFI